MSVPLDRLYHYIKSLCNDDILIYRWFPHGSKKLKDLKLLNKPEDFTGVSMVKRLYYTPAMICHDQEPLYYDAYTKQDFLDYLDAKRVNYTHPKYKKLKSLTADTHLRSVLDSSGNFYKYTLLCHSEKNSQDLKLYENNNFLGVYYWSHALIARDWYRFAEHDTSIITNTNNFQKDFLIYNRAWAGTREYRLKFVELLLDTQLLPYCDIKFNPVDSELHYSKHQFKNSKFKLSRVDLEHCIPLNSISSDASADYVNFDYQQCAIEVVLETLFDDKRNHLTEKTLRPIACGKPFVLTATPHSLQYLRDYGFKTFDGLIDESYDKIVNHRQRLDAIIYEMKRIAMLEPAQKRILFDKLHQIAEYNKTRFFSQDFHNTVTNEFVENFNSAVKICKQHKSSALFKLILDPTVVPNVDEEAMTSEELEFLSWAKQQIKSESSQ